MSFNPIHGVKSPGDVENNFSNYFADADENQLLADFNFAGDWLTAQWNNFSGITAQQELQSNAQEFQEYMYQQYNSPEALKRQFEEAGLNTNLLGSTSFGTAQGSSGAPAVNAPASVASDVANAVTQGASNLSDVPLKSSQSDYYASYPALNDALKNKYGIDAMYTEKEYEFFCDTYDWKLDYEEFNSKTMRENFYYAVQRVKTAKQEYENLVKEGQILEHDITYHDYLAKVQKEVYDYWVQHGMPPSSSWQDKFWDNYVYGGDEKAFNRFLRGFRLQEDMRNESIVKSGANNGKVKIGGFEVDTATIEYCIEHGIDLFEYLQKNSTDDSTWLGKVKSWLGFGDNSDSKPSSKPIPKSESDKYSVQGCANLLFNCASERGSFPSMEQFMDYAQEFGIKPSYVSAHWNDIKEQYHKFPEYSGK